jgi:hypothetical protein
LQESPSKKKGAPFGTRHFQTNDSTSTSMQQGFILFHNQPTSKLQRQTIIGDNDDHRDEAHRRDETQANAAKEEDD